MKNLFILPILFLLASCASEPYEKKQYNFEIITTNGDTIYQSYVGVGTNLFSLKHGDITTNGFTKTLVSGVRTYKVTSIKSLGMQTQKEAEACDCRLKQIETNEE